MMRKPWSPEPTAPQHDDGKRGGRDARPEGSSRRVGEVAAPALSGPPAKSPLLGEDDWAALSDPAHAEKSLARAQWAAFDSGRDLARLRSVCAAR